MLHPHQSTRRHFTEAARAAAQAKRQDLARHPRDKHAPELFVVRPTPTSTAYGWETRRYGSLVLTRSPAHYETVAGARAAGELANPSLSSTPAR